MIQTVIQIGNSLGVTLPRDFVTKNKISKGSQVLISASTHIPKSTEYVAISDNEFLNAVKDVELHYGDALNKLALLQ